MGIAQQYSDDDNGIHNTAVRTGWARAFLLVRISFLNFNPFTISFPFVVRKSAQNTGDSFRGQTICLKYNMKSGFKVNIGNFGKARKYSTLVFKGTF